jgi:hypothetical protein
MNPSIPDTEFFSSVEDKMAARPPPSFRVPSPPASAPTAPELEQGPPTPEHRQFPRARLGARFEVTVGEDAAPTFRAGLDSENISVSGAFLHSTFFLPLGTRVRVRFTLPSGEEILAEAQVVREERLDRQGKGRSGMGLRFARFYGQSDVGLTRLFIGDRLAAFAEEYLRSPRAKSRQGEHERVVDALAAWELEQRYRLEDPWPPPAR